MNLLLNTDAMANFNAILPEILLTLLAVSVILLDAFSPASRRRTVGFIAALGMALIALVAFLLPVPGKEQQLMLGGMLREGEMSKLFVVITLIAAAIASLIAMDAPIVGKQGEFYAIIIVATVG